MDAGKGFQIPKGVLTEVSGSAGGGKTEAILRALARALAAEPELRVAWLEREFSVNPAAFARRGVSLERFFFVDLGRADAKSALWAAHQVLASQLFGAVVLAAPVMEEVALRRLQLAAGRQQAAVVLVGEAPRPGNSWPIQLRLRASRCPESGELRLETLKSKLSTGTHQGGGIPWRIRSA